MRTGPDKLKLCCLSIDWTVCRAHHKLSWCYITVQRLCCLNDMEHYDTLWCALLSVCWPSVWRVIRSLRTDLSDRFKCWIHKSSHEPESTQLRQKLTSASQRRPMCCVLTQRYILTELTAVRETAITQSKLLCPKAQKFGSQT